MSTADHTVMRGIWGRNAPAGNAMEKPKNKGFSLIKMMSLNYRKEKNPQQQQQQHHNNMPFMIHSHIGKEIKHICSNCSRVSHAQDEEVERLASVVSGSHCRSRFGSLGRLLKPWKWNKKKSQDFTQMSTALERKMSVRQSREELIKRGVLKEIFEKDSRSTAVTPADQMKNTLPSDCERTAEDRQRTDTADFRVSLDGGLCAQDNTLQSLTLPHKKTVTFPSDLQEPPAKPPLIHKQPPALPPKPFSRRTNHSTAETQTCSRRTNHSTAETQTCSRRTNHSTDPCLQGKPCPQKLVLYSSSWGQCCGPLQLQYSAAHPSSRIILELQKTLALTLHRLDSSAVHTGQYSAPLRAVDIDCDADKENIPNESDYQDLPCVYKDEEQEEDEEDEDDSLFTNALVLKILRKDSLAVKLSNRPSPRELQEKNILPVQTDEERLQSRQLIGKKLTGRLSQRPTAEELEQRNILKPHNEEEQMEEKREIRRRLSHKLSQRPTVEDLRRARILTRFCDYVEVSDAQDYDRRADKPWTRLTAADKAAIRKELNDFKSHEMEVHESSRHLTRFHRP
ncbi:phosphatase and actin regulator 1 isoform X3 [Carassius gibelio]|uniref:phosphatase and actin regulator 1 isoform X3 n=1 Tax=Carassius gibelio TaxID=101364 RepID=UPI002277A6E6|nr:phosphatase and actin regulator 1 isoform X3 [Carassius gibelio]